MWMEEQNKDRVNVKRTLQLLDALGPMPAAGSPEAGANGKTIASACPFCMTMLTDGIKSKSLEDRVRQMDVSELLERACDMPAVSTDVIRIESPPEAPAVVAEASAE